MSERRYDGPPLDGTEQYITERPVQPGSATDGRTEYATEPEQGEETTENVPLADADVDEPTDDPGPDVDDDPRHWRARGSRSGDGNGRRDDPPETEGQSTLGDWGDGS